MAANTAPIFALTPNVGIMQAILTANTTTDLTAGTIYLLFTAGANGAWLEEIRFRPLGSNVATVLRLWLNNGSTTGTAANSSLFYEYAVLQTTVSQIAAQPAATVRLQKAIPAGYRIYATVATGVAAGFDSTAWGGDY